MTAISKTLASLMLIFSCGALAQIEEVEQTAPVDDEAMMKELEEALSSDTRADAENCLRISSIRRTKVANDKTILFYMSKKRVFMNVLSRKCPGLAREGRFMYQTRQSRLCDLDIITVLNDFGLGLDRGASCGLGKFYPISVDDAKALLERGNQTQG